MIHLLVQENVDTTASGWLVAVPEELGPFAWLLLHSFLPDKATVMGIKS